MPKAYIHTYIHTQTNTKHIQVRVSLTCKCILSDEGDEPERNRKKGGTIIPYTVRAVETDSVVSLRRDSQCLQGAEIKGVVRYHPQGGR